MDALTSIVTHVPDWFQKLDALSSQIVQRQLELAALDEAAHSRGRRTIRNRGSTESLKAKDENATDATPPAANGEDDGSQRPSEGVLEALATSPSAQEGSRPRADGEPPSGYRPGFAPPRNIPLPKTMEELQARAAGMVKAKNVKAKSASVASINLDEERQTFRTRSIIIVYYDSFVQVFFEDLVKFVSASRNLMRKAKMAAKVAHIKKMAEKDFGGEDDAAADGGNVPMSAELALASIRMTRYSRMGMGMGMGMSRDSGLKAGGGGSKKDPPDIYAMLDESLEFVQTVCERAAHQFLRDGDCNDEISSIRKRLETTLEMAQKELERLRTEGASASGNDGGGGGGGGVQAATAVRARTLRPASMRREMTPGKKSSDIIVPSEDVVSVASRKSAAAADKRPGSQPGSRPGSRRRQYSGGPPGVVAVDPNEALGDVNDNMGLPLP